MTKFECSVLRGLAILCIVFHNFMHWLPDAVHENEFFFDVNNTYSFCEKVCSGDFFVQMFSFWGHLGVPVFVFLSGYGLALKYSDQYPITRKRFLVHHYMKLWIPLILGTIFYLLAVLFVEGRLNMNISRVIMQSLMILNLCYPYEQHIDPGPYWYFGLTLQLYVIYAFCVYRRRSVYLVAITFLSCIVLSLINGVEYRENILIWAKYNSFGWMLPFCMGILFPKYDLTAVENRIYIWLLVIATLLLFVMEFHYQLWLFVPAFAVIFFVSVMKLIPDFVKKVLSSVGDLSMYLFVIHPIIRALTFPFVSPRNYYLIFSLYLVLSLVSAVLTNRIVFYFRKVVVI